MWFRIAREVEGAKRWRRRLGGRSFGEVKRTTQL